jgi:cell division protein FtsI (penicillin-binding protein 3)
VISRRTADRLRAILVSVTEPEGTGGNAAIAGFQVAGKTGTAQKINPETRRYDPQAVVSSFIGFVPAESPKFLLLVVVDGPKGHGWGGTVAAPVFRRIAGETLHYLGVMPTSPPPPLLARAAKPARPPAKSPAKPPAKSNVALPISLPEHLSAVAPIVAPAVALSVE